MSGIELTGGAWVTRGVIRKWQVVETVQPDEEPQQATAELIACPTCHAKLTEVCRTPSGHVTDEHDSRIVPRQCGCGAPVPPRCKYCPPCRARRDQASKNESARLRRARERAAA